MFKHRGETRTLQHNLRIASLLSFVAGLVNVAGFLAVQRLTTNVTGHFAFFVDELFKLNFLQGFIFFLYIFFFFLGSFVSSFLVELFYKKNFPYVYVLPALIESAILLSVPLFGDLLVLDHPDSLAFLLLFAMGLQNSLVTTISNAAVRTTHLTGLFTDLGIELSQLFFYREHTQRTRLFSSIRLRLTIIFFFFVGGMTGGVFYSSIQLNVLLIAAGVLMLGIALDYWGYAIRKIFNRNA
ncbi:MAG: DUF1275 domain-containing protein [Cyclobacteriaceae bacterium]|nr:DUF1275 domain-containing protein [Cyclobacteriaceae bacterium]